MRDRKATGTFREERAAPCGKSRRLDARRSPKGSTQGREPFARCRFAAWRRAAGRVLERRLRVASQEPPDHPSADGRVDKMGFVTAARGAVEAPHIRFARCLSAPRSLLARRDKLFDSSGRTGCETDVARDDARLRKNSCEPLQRRVVGQVQLERRHRDLVVADRGEVRPLLWFHFRALEPDPVVRKAAPVSALLDL